MTICYLGLGSNLKTPERILRLAILTLKKMPKSAVLAVAPFYKTAPWGVHAQPYFCNTAVKIHTTLSPIELLNQCQKIEKEFGRVRKKRWGPRTLDIDILFYGNKTMNTPRLTLPHPYIFQRDFVLKPLHDLVHGKNYQSRDRKEADMKLVICKNLPLKHQLQNPN